MGFSIALDVYTITNKSLPGWVTDVYPFLFATGYETIGCKSVLSGNGQV